VSVIRNHGFQPYDSTALEADAMSRFPECREAHVVNGLTAFFEIVEVVQLWVNPGDSDHYKPKHEISYAIEDQAQKGSGE
jgi:hypothetical protein